MITVKRCVFQGTAQHLRRESGVAAGLGNRNLCRSVCHRDVYMYICYIYMCVFYRDVHVYFICIHIIYIHICVCVIDIYICM